MPTPTRPSSLSGLRGIQNARSRIYAAGSDPLFGPGGTRREPRVTSARFPLTATTNNAARPVWQRNWLDRLQPTLTRFRD